MFSHLREVESSSFADNLRGVHSITEEDLLGRLTGRKKTKSEYIVTSSS